MDSSNRASDLDPTNSCPSDDHSALILVCRPLCPDNLGLQVIYGRAYSKFGTRYTGRAAVVFA